ncbi:MAG TPA: TonB family protein [Pyrinomonadaceae bacterium]|jgi:TonB family protein
MRFNRLKTLLLTLLPGFTLLVAGLPAALAQSAPDWETLKPAEEFTVLMPAGSTNEAAEYSYHQRILKTHLFLSTSKSGPVMAVATMIGIKSNPALYSEAQRLNSYVDAFRTWFPQKIRGKDAIGKLTLAGDKTLNGHAGREYRVTIADLNGTAQVFVTRKRFYAIVVLNTKKDDALQEKFLGSFVLPEKSAEVQANVAAKPENQEAPAPPADAQPSPAKPGDRTRPDAGTGDTAPKPVETTGGADSQSSKKAPISGGVLNGKALSLPAPEYPAIARSAKASGTVTVKVTIDEYGNVAEANAVSGHPLLREAAVAAAREAKFSPTLLMGEPMRVVGVLTYNFVP